LTVFLRDPPIRVILLDIEGTTTPVEFVYQVLFPYARNQLRKFVHQQSETIVPEVEALHKEHALDVQQGLNPPAWADGTDSPLPSMITYVEWLMDRDRKSPTLKSLQGKIWQEGYLNGELKGKVYADVPVAFERWSRQGRDICIFSSGSVLAQKLLFAHTTEGDLMPFIRDYFDTSTGAKTAEQSYRRIAAALKAPASEIVFLSDTVGELDAAKLAGVETAWCIRSAQHQPESPNHPVIRTFDEIFCAPRVSAVQASSEPTS
jgi:enolase-phosphatase E1